MTDSGAVASACGIDSVEIARVERLLAQTPPEQLDRLFSAQELTDAGDGPGRAASLAARFAAKEACLKLFPREAALGRIEPTDFSVARDNYGAPQVVPSPSAQYVMDLHRIGKITLSMTHDRVSASAVALAERAPIVVPAYGRFIDRFLPLRRDVIMTNLRRVFGATLGEDEIGALAQAHYGHLLDLTGEFLHHRWMSRERKNSLVDVQNIPAFVAALEQKKGVLVLTGHFGNWEVSTTAAIAKFPQMHGKFHFVRRAIKPDWLDRLVNRRFNQAGFGVFPKRGSLDAMLDCLERGEVIVFPFDQHAGPPDGIPIDFFGEPAWTFKSLAIIALATGAPVLPASSWREPNGQHVLRFGEPMSPIEAEDTNEAIRLNTRSYNAALERLIVRHPEQWYWVHRRWKHAEAKQRVRRVRANDPAGSVIPR
jgi:KDO2-lipid IV(A) lauroyltransferase